MRRVEQPVRCEILGVLFALLFSPMIGAGEPEEATNAAAARLRRPQALAFSDDQKLLYTANRCGSVSVIDLDQMAVVAEYDVGKRLSDIERLDSGKIVITDEEAHELIVASTSGADLRVETRLPVSPYPVSLVVDPERRTAFVASLWSRRLSRVEIVDGHAQVTQQLDLEIAPRAQVLAPQGEYLIVADSFSGRIAVVDLEPFQLSHMRDFPGHNIRGLACTPNAEMLIVAHQMLNDLARTERNDVHWGLLMSNDLRWLRVSTVLSASEDLYAGAHMHPLGEAGSAMADPSGLAITATGIAIVTLGGVNEVAIGKEQDFSFYRLPVGKRPTAVVTTADSQSAYVANTFADSVTKIDLAARKIRGEVSLGSQPPLSLVDRGELLFYDGSLSHDRWMSCHSCHTDGHANGGLNDNFSDGSFGAAKRVLSLLGVAHTEPLAWNGAVDDLVTQLQNSTQHTMQKDDSLSESQSTALVAYLQTLEPPPSVDALRGQLNPDAIARGAELFADKGCVECHAPPLYTTAGTYDVGFADQQGNRHFNPPSLRGLSQRGPYFHDNRAANLADVFRTHQHQLDEPLTDAQLTDLVAFLRSL